MTFTPEQIAALDAPLSKGNVRARAQGGRQVSYIEGWHAIAEANRIFGFGDWSRETIETKCVAERERTIGQSNKGWGVTYIARVRISVGTVVRDGCGSGHGIDRDLGQAHESAIKEAETDAMKRALMTFGNPFGLALYDKEQTNVVDDTAVDSRAAFFAECAAAIESAQSAQALQVWWDSETQRKARRDFDLTKDQVSRLKELVIAQHTRLGKPSAKASTNTLNGG